MYYFYIRGSWKSFIIITMNLYHELMFDGFRICDMENYSGGRYMVVYDDQVLLET